jgi:hypothetical protein
MLVKTTTILGIASLLISICFFWFKYPPSAAFGCAGVISITLLLLFILNVFSLGIKGANKKRHILMCLLIIGLLYCQFRLLELAGERQIKAFLSSDILIYNKIIENINHNRSKLSDNGRSLDNLVDQSVRGNTHIWVYEC